MLKHRIIPVLLYDYATKQAVKTVQFKYPGRPVGSMMQHILNYQKRDIDELIVLDYRATIDGREPDYSAVERYASQLYCPLVIGGGVRSIQHIKNLLNSGADKVAIKTATHIIPEAVHKFGAQAIIGVLDYQRDHALKKVLIEMAFEFTKVGEVLLTSMDHEGMRGGYDPPVIAHISKLLKCPIIANGGCGKPEHMLEAIQAGADAVAASSMFLFTDTTPKSCAKYLHEAGVPVRL